MNTMSSKTTAYGSFFVASGPSVLGLIATLIQIIEVMEHTVCSAARREESIRLYNQCRTYYVPA